MLPLIEKEDVMKGFSAEFVGGMVFIAALIGMAIGDVGNVSVCDGEPIDAALPFMVALVTLFPFIVGYRAGRAENH